jgi:hypothetical protein
MVVKVNRSRGVSENPSKNLGRVIPGKLAIAPEDGSTSG